MNYFKKRKLKKHIKNINWKYIEEYGAEYYKQSGEYQALKWLKSYVEGRAGCEPKELINSILNTGREPLDRTYLLTLWKWM